LIFILWVSMYIEFGSKLFDLYFRGEHVYRVWQ
jgi:hypothetical protein